MPSCPAKEPALLGKVIAGRYRVVQLLASGGIGDVYLGEPIAPGRKTGPDGRRRVAVKVLRDEHRDRPELSTRFRREAEAAARVRHENVIGVIEMPSEKDGVLCFVTELLVGLDLADTLAYSGALGAARSAKIACGAADGLAAAHEAGVVHRDVKPENIFLVHAADGREAVRLIDFGLASISGDDPRATPRVVGTPEYMAPEQARGAPASARADVYSLGIVLFEMIAGRVPFWAPYPEIARLHAEAPIPELGTFASLSADLEAVIMRALDKDPERRFASMGEMRRALSSAPEAACA